MLFCFSLRKLVKRCFTRFFVFFLNISPAIGARPKPALSGKVGARAHPVGVVPPPTPHPTWLQFVTDKQTDNSTLLVMIENSELRIHSNYSNPQLAKMYEKCENSDDTNPKVT